jgi:hypothetical protein
MSGNFKNNLQKDTERRDVALTHEETARRGIREMSVTAKPISRMF